MLCIVRENSCYLISLRERSKWGGILGELRSDFCHLKCRKERRIGINQSWAVCWEGMQAEKWFGIYGCWSKDEQQMSNLELLFGQSQLAKCLSPFCNASGKIRKRSLHSQQVRFGLFCADQRFWVLNVSQSTASKPHQGLWAPVISSKNQQFSCIFFFCYRIVLLMRWCFVLV